MRLAMIRISERLKEQKKETKMLLQIHDELILAQERCKRISKIIIDEMSSVAKSDLHSFAIPLTVDLNIGKIEAFIKFNLIAQIRTI